MNTTLPPAHQTVPVMPHPAATVHTAQMMLGTITRICLSQKETGQRQMVEIVQGSEHTWVQIQNPALKIGQLEPMHPFQSSQFNRFLGFPESTPTIRFIANGAKKWY